MIPWSPEAQESLLLEIRRSSGLSDADRIRIFRDLWRAVEAIQKTKTPDQLRRETIVRRQLDIEPGLANYEACVERSE